MLKAVIFDLDGTLLDTMPDISRAVNRALEEAGFPPRPYEAFRYLLGSGSKNLIRKACPEDATEEAQGRVMARYREIIARHACDLTRPYPGTREALEKLRGAGLTVGIITNKYQATAHMVIGHFFPDFPLALLWGNNGQRPLKPDPSSALALQRELGLRPEEIAYVGDSDVDMIYARRTGMLACGAVWGYRGRQELAENGAEILAENISELAEKLLRCR